MAYWLEHFIRKRFLLLLVSSYVFAALLPGPGLLIRDVSLGEFTFRGESTNVSLPMLLLGLLLWNAGLSVEIAQLKGLFLHPLALVAGLFANLVLPLLFIFAVALGMRSWHNADEVQNILVGLALIASMPIAGSSTAWTQRANGNMVLSLGLVLFSTVLSPLTTPVALHSVGLITTGDYSEDLQELAASGTGKFLGLCVVLPSILGIITRCALRNSWFLVLKPWLKLGSSGVLLTLLYSNAATSLPQIVGQPDWDFLGLILILVASLCGIAFASGWLIARLLKADAAQQTSLMYGLGMNNNGTGLVLATVALADHPLVMLPIIAYNLIQHIAAGAVEALRSRL
jgi:BASS family bile acid:Na+ symporter